MKVLKIILGLCLVLGLGLHGVAQAAMHWNKNMPMVYVPADNEYTDLMLKAFGEWEGKFNRKIQFIKTTFYRDLRLTEIEVQFNQVGGEGAQNSGNTTVEGSSDIIRHGTIVINTKFDEEIEKDPEKKAKNTEEIYRIMLHQVGRVMGLESSTNPKSVMYDKIEDGQTILDEDVQNVYALYGWAPSIRIVR